MELARLTNNRCCVRRTTRLRLLSSTALALLVSPLLRLGNVSVTAFQSLVSQHRAPLASSTAGSTRCHLLFRTNGSNSNSNSSNRQFVEESASAAAAAAGISVPSFDEQSASRRVPREDSRPIPSNEPQGNSRRNAVDMALIESLWYNQASVLLLATTVASVLSVLNGVNPIEAAFHLPASANLLSLDSIRPPSSSSLLDGPLSVLRTAAFQGALAAVPVVLIGQAVHDADTREANNASFSTASNVISLFGRRRRPMQSWQPALSSMSDPSNHATTDAVTMTGLSASIAAASAVSEEIVFRGYLDHALAAVTNSVPLAIVAQAALFGIGHISSRRESGVVGTTQFVNGVIYGILFHATGGNILACIAAHFFHDLHVLIEAWTTVNDQMDYTQEKMAEQRERRSAVPQSQHNSLEDVQSQAGLPSLSGQTIDYVTRFFYAFDREHRGSLSLSDAQRAVTYAFCQGSNNGSSSVRDGQTCDRVPSTDTVERVFHEIVDSRQSAASSDRLNVGDFLRLLFVLRTGRY